MSVAIYPRLGEVLRAKGLSVVQLKREIEETFGLSVDVKTLYRLASGGPIQRADLIIAGAVSKILDVSLGDLFTVEATPLDAGPDDEVPHPPMLDAEESQRLAELFERQSEGTITDVEQRELEALVTTYSARLRALRVKEIARSRGISLEDAQRLIADELREALAGA